jgi:lipoyl(octanoyl) transferase
VDVIELGLINYQEAHRQQLELHEQVVKQERSNTLLVCAHPPIVTLGKQGSNADLLGWPGDVVEVERGGKATLHGPHQIILYPIIDLKSLGQNLGGLLRSLERAVIRTLSSYELSSRGNPSYAGVWLSPKGQCNDELKIASIGIAVRRWVSFHGLAFNYDRPEVDLNLLLSCGHRGNELTSLCESLPAPPPREQVLERLIENFCDELHKLPS